MMDNADEFSIDSNEQVEQLDAELENEQDDGVVLNNGEDVDEREGEEESEAVEAVEEGDEGGEEEEEEEEEDNVDDVAEDDDLPQEGDEGDEGGEGDEGNAENEEENEEAEENKAEDVENNEQTDEVNQNEVEAVEEKETEEEKKDEEGEDGKKEEENEEKEEKEVIKTANETNVSTVNAEHVKTTEEKKETTEHKPVGHGKVNYAYIKPKGDTILMNVCNPKNINLTEINANNENSKHILFPSLSPTDMPIPGKEKENITMLHMDPEKCGYKYSSGVNPAEGYLFVYPHVSNSNIPPKIRKKRSVCC